MSQKKRDFDFEEHPPKNYIHPITLLQEEVGLWSKVNFGFQISKTEPNLTLNSLVPLLGIVEELGEYERARDVEARKDALADAVIFLCDYTSREGILLDHLVRMEYTDYINLRGKNGALVCVGEMCHLTLKHHQGIRGMDDEEKYRLELHKVVFRLLGYLDYECWFQFNSDLLDITIPIWKNVVSKRNWKKNKRTGRKDERSKGE